MVEAAGSASPSKGPPRPRFSNRMTQAVLEELAVSVAGCLLRCLADRAMSVAVEEDVVDEGPVVAQRTRDRRGRSMEKAVRATGRGRVVAEVVGLAPPRIRDAELSWVCSPPCGAAFVPRLRDGRVTSGSLLQKHGATGMGEGGKTAAILGGRMQMGCICRTAERGLEHFMRE